MAKFHPSPRFIAPHHPSAARHAHHCEIFGGFEDAEISRAAHAAKRRARPKLPCAETTVAGGLRREDSGRWSDDSHRPLVISGGGN